MATEGNGLTPSRDLGRGWKVSPSITIASGEERVIADIEGSGVIQQVWKTLSGV